MLICRKFSLSQPLTEKESRCQNSDASSINSDEILADVRKSDRRTVVHEKLSNGWAKKAVKRTKGVLAGKWDVYLLTPDMKILRSQHDLKIYIAKSGAIVDSNVINFILPKKTALVRYIYSRSLIKKCLDSHFFHTLLNYFMWCLRNGSL